MELPGTKDASLEPRSGVAGRLGEGGWRAPTARMSGRELRDYASEQRRIALDELQAFSAALGRHRESRQNLEAELAHAWSDLLALLLPSLEAPALASVSALLELADLEPDVLTRRSEARRTELTAALAALAANDRQPPPAASAALEKERTRLEGRLERLGETLDALEAEPTFFTLVAARFDTPDYDGRLWQRRYHRHRAQAAALVARHGAGLRARRFGQLYSRYVFEKAAYDRLSLARASLLARTAEAEARASRRQQMESELQALPEWELLYARARIRQNLSQTPEGRALRPFLDDPQLGPAAHAVIGLETRLLGLAALRAECLDEPRLEAERALARVDSVLAEFRSPDRKLDAVHLRDDVERSYSLPLARWRELRGRHEAAVGKPS
jgi:hypothetical protein